MESREHWPAWYGRELAESTPELCADADELYRRAVHERPYRTPGALGVQLMDRTMPRTMRREPVMEWPAPALRSDTATVESWTRELSPAEQRAGWLHAYDKNAQFLAACSSVPLGLGELMRWNALDGSVVFDARLAGYWRVGTADGYEWWTTPRVAYATRELERVGEVLGTDRARLELAEAYVWERSGRALERWYALLRDARAYLLPWRETDAGELAWQALKATYAAGIGHLDGGWFKPNAREGRAGDLQNPRFRPDWRHMIVDQARVNLRRTVDRWPAVVACYRDCLFVVSDCPDAYVAGVDHLKFGATPGAFKVAGSWPLSSELRAAIDGGKVGRLLRLLRERDA